MPPLPLGFASLRKVVCAPARVAPVVARSLSRPPLRFFARSGPAGPSARRARFARPRRPPGLLPPVGFGGAAPSFAGYRFAPLRGPRCRSAASPSAAAPSRRARSPAPRSSVAGSAASRRLRSSGGRPVPPRLGCFRAPLPPGGRGRRPAGRLPCAACRPLVAAFAAPGGVGCLAACGPRLAALPGFCCPGCGGPFSGVLRLSVALCGA